MFKYEYKTEEGNLEKCEITIDKEKIKALCDRIKPFKLRGYFDRQGNFHRHPYILWEDQQYPYLLEILGMLLNSVNSGECEAERLGFKKLKEYAKSYELIPFKDRIKAAAAMIGTKNSKDEIYIREISNLTEMYFDNLNYDFEELNNIYNEAYKYIYSNKTLPFYIDDDKRKGSLKTIGPKPNNKTTN